VRAVQLIPHSPHQQKKKNQNPKKHPFFWGFSFNIPSKRPKKEHLKGVIFGALVQLKVWAHQKSL
jgi:hypothetical protein